MKYINRFDIRVTFAFMVFFIIAVLLIQLNLYVMFNYKNLIAMVTFITTITLVLGWDELFNQCTKMLLDCHDYMVVSDSVKSNAILTVKCNILYGLVFTGVWIVIGQPT